MALGQRLKAARKHARLTQNELADRSRVSQKTISKIERGDQASSTAVVRLAAACGVRAEWLSDDSGPMMLRPEAVAQTRATYGVDDLTAEAIEIARRWQRLARPHREALKRLIEMGEKKIRVKL